ncbi:50S ribosomal protein L23 [Amantichitinum ursilacus]|uniref:Large ribosomal subunit protein uL23 n=1 Tax=Amantichitinum ursilacus TaxID=857265 RepID=A0A0N1JRA9_9NEIS|nr:50S ribosomal protein L23 [Amantichitinum ursilacus]KPC49258.1 50S ribosomal protein L23 [Amantichitinum ursilacus]
MTQFTENRLLQVLRAPVVSEKSTFVAEKNEQIVFRVSTDATKAEIAAAIELLFKVKVEAVQVVNVKGKVKRSGRFTGRRASWKKAYISLVAGQEIDLSAAQ